MAQNNKRELNITDLADNLIGEDGIKTDVQVGMGNAMLFKVGGVIVVSVFFGVALGIFVGNTITK